MLSDSYSVRYRPTSPLAPSIPAIHGSSSPQSARSRASQSKSGSRSLRLDLPNYPGYPSRGQAASPSPAMQSPAITLNRGTQPTAMESPRLMREKQKELIARAQLTSKLAASPMSAKPDAPRLDPLGSPKGPVTPLMLEEHEVVDYFTVTAPGRLSPIPSPGGRSSRSSMSSSTEEKRKKKHKVDLF